MDKVKQIIPEQGKRLKECRKEKGMTQEQLAKDVGYTVQAINYIENGKRRLSTDSAFLLSKALDIRYQYLLCEDDYKTLKNMYSESIEFDMREKTFENAIAEQGYLPMAVLGEPLGTVYDELYEEADTLYEVKKYIILTAEETYVECSEKEYNTLIDEIYDYIGFRLKKFTSTCKKASDSDIRLYNEHFGMDKDNKEKEV